MITDIPIASNRVVCAVCDKVLKVDGKFVDLTVNCTNGTIILCCSKHAEDGEHIMQIANQLARMLNK